MYKVFSFRKVMIVVSIIATILVILLIAQLNERKTPHLSPQTLTISAASNSVSTENGANIQLDLGTYEVSVSSDLNLGSGSSDYDVNKVLLWTDSVGYPDGWFWVVQEGVPQTISIQHISQATVTVWAVLPDAGIGDNTGHAIIKFISH